MSTISGSLAQFYDVIHCMFILCHVVLTFSLGSIFSASHGKIWILFSQFVLNMTLHDRVK